jgi:hypothetical protein
MNILRAICDPKVFAQHFKNADTWVAWRAFLAALFALPMTEEQLTLYRKHTGRATPPSEALSRPGWYAGGAPASRSSSRWSRCSSLPSATGGLTSAPARWVRLW